MKRHGMESGPERLVDRPEWKDTIGPLARERFDEARLERGARKLRAAIAAGALGGGGALVASGAKPGAAVAAAKSVGLAAAAVKVAIPLAIVAIAGSGVGVWFAKHEEARTPAVEKAAPVQAEPEAEIDDGTDGDEDLQEGDEAVVSMDSAQKKPDERPVHKRKRHRRAKAAKAGLLAKGTGERPSASAVPAEPAASVEDRGEGHLPLKDAPERSVDPTREESSAPPSDGAPLWPKPERGAKEEPPAKAADKPADKPARKTESELDVELRLFHAAENRLKKGDADGALEALAKLEAEHPNAPLGPEIALLRTEALVRAGRADDAIQFIQRTAEARWPAAKKAELYRVLGDLFTSRHACADAKDAYTRALSLGLKGEHKTRAEAALRECVPKK